MEPQDLQAQVNRLGFGAVAVLRRLSRARLAALLHPEPNEEAPPAPALDDAPTAPLLFPCRERPIQDEERRAVTRVLQDCPWPVSAAFIAHRAGLMPSRAEGVLVDLVAQGHAERTGSQYQGRP